MLLVGLQKAARSELRLSAHLLWCTKGLAAAAFYIQAQQVWIRLRVQALIFPHVYLNLKHSV